MNTSSSLILIVLWMRLHSALISCCCTQFPLQSSFREPSPTCRIPFIVQSLAKYEFIRAEPKRIREDCHWLQVYVRVSAIGLTSRRAIEVPNGQICKNPSFLVRAAINHVRSAVTTWYHSKNEQLASLELRKSFTLRTECVRPRAEHMNDTAISNGFSEEPSCNLLRR